MDRRPWFRGPPSSQDTAPRRSSHHGRTVEPSPRNGLFLTPEPSAPLERRPRRLPSRARECRPDGIPRRVRGFFKDRGQHRGGPGLRASATARLGGFGRAVTGHPALALANFRSWSAPSPPRYPMIKRKRIPAPVSPRAERRQPTGCRARALDWLCAEPPLRDPEHENGPNEPSELCTTPACPHATTTRGGKRVERTQPGVTAWSENRKNKAAGPGAITTPEEKHTERTQPGVTARGENRRNEAAGPGAITIPEAKHTERT
jgi:hypothetical protein